MTELAAATDLFCERDDRVLFENLSFCINQGDIIHVKGPNGAGKTTLLRRLVGLSWVVEGDIHWNKLVSDNGRRLDGHCCWYLAHRPAVTLLQSPLENLAFAAALHGCDATEEDLWQALKTVGLNGYEDVPAHSLSAGQQRRVALARLYLPVSSVKVWILDEPFTALDVDAVAQLESRITSFAAEGGTVIMTSHHGLKDTKVRELKIGVRG